MLEVRRAEKSLGLKRLRNSKIVLMYEVGIKIPTGLEDLGQRGRMRAAAKVLTECNSERNNREDREKKGATESRWAALICICME